MIGGVGMFVVANFQVCLTKLNLNISRFLSAEVLFVFVIFNSKGKKNIVVAFVNFLHYRLSP